MTRDILQYYRVFLEKLCEYNGVFVQTLFYCVVFDACCFRVLCFVMAEKGEESESLPQLCGDTARAGSIARTAPQIFY